MIKINTLTLFYQLAVGRFSKNTDFDEGKNRFKFFTRGLLTLPYTLPWLEFLNSFPKYRDFLYRNPRISTKLHRPYMFRACTLKERLRILTFHYTWQEKVFSPEQQRLLLEGQSLELAHLTVKDSKKYQIFLAQNLQFQKEGELSLQLTAEDKVLAVISFSIYQSSDGITTLLVGGLQGSVKGDDYSLIKEATKSCYGLFPKKLAFEALMEFANLFDIHVVNLVSNEGHVGQHWRYQKEIFANYDNFWLELGGSKLNEHLYILRYPIYHKPLEQVESKKRSEYKKRQLLLDELKTKIRLELFH